MIQYRVSEITRLNIWKIVGRGRVKAIHSLRQQLKPTRNKVTYWYLWKMLKGDRTRLFVAIAHHNRSSEIAGVALLVSDVILGGRRDSLEELVVHPNHRRKGIARLLVDVMTQESGARGAKHINLMVSHDNPAAYKLYASRGFASLDDRGMLRYEFCRALSR